MARAASPRSSTRSPPCPAGPSPSATPSRSTGSGWACGRPTCHAAGRCRDRRGPAARVDPSPCSQHGARRPGLRPTPPASRRSKMTEVSPPQEGSQGLVVVGNEATCCAVPYTRQAVCPGRSPPRPPQPRKRVAGRFQDGDRFVVGGVGQPQVHLGQSQVHLGQRPVVQGGREQQPGEQVPGGGVEERVGTGAGFVR